MESAIPLHLKCPRSQPARAPEDYVPAYPAWTARLGAGAAHIVMAYFGIQYKSAEAPEQAGLFADKMREHFAAENGPGHFEFAHYVDEAGYDSLLAIAYWSVKAQYQAWQAHSPSSAWWDSPERLDGGAGYFREIFQPGGDRFETLFAMQDKLEGIASLGEPSGGEVREHGYWGAMRDRLAVAQTDALLPGLLPKVVYSAHHPARIRVSGQENLTVIRSGQEWTETEGKEREIFLRKVEPTCRRGMEFLRDSGLAIGCYLNRYMAPVDAGLAPLQKRFGLSFWRSLRHLENWAEHHPTHAAIFGSFMKMVDEVKADLRLRAYHEVAVVAAEDQFYEYIGCHGATGMLKACVAQQPPLPDA